MVGNISRPRSGSHWHSHCKNMLTLDLQEANDHKANVWYMLMPPTQQRGDTERDFVVGPDFTRRPVKYERFIRPMGLRYKKAHVTHPELKGGLHNLQGPQSQFHHFCLVSTSRGPLYFKLQCSDTVTDSNLLDSHRSAPDHLSQEGNEPYPPPKTPPTHLTHHSEPAKPHVHTARSTQQRHNNRMQRQVRSLPPPILTDPYPPLTPISELGMVTAGGKVVWGRYAQITVRLSSHPKPAK